MYNLAEAFAAIQQGQGMHRAQIAGAYFGITGASWQRWVKQFKLDQGILLSARNRSWTGAYLKDLREKMEQGLWPPQNKKMEMPVSEEYAAAFTKACTAQRGKRTK